MRPLEIPTVADRIAQMVIKLILEPIVEPRFHQDSYGYRPGKSALDAVAVARERCWRMNWIIDLDIGDFFGSLDHGLMMKAVKHHADLKWTHLCIERMLVHVGSLFRIRDKLLNRFPQALHSARFRLMQSPRPPNRMSSAPIRFNSFFYTRASFRFDFDSDTDIDLDFYHNAMTRQVADRHPG